MARGGEREQQGRETSDPLRSVRSWHRCLCAAFLLMCAAASASPSSDRAPWVLVDTRAFTLSVLDSRNHLIARFRDIAIGSGGVADVHYHGDATTPRGTFHVAWINPRSPFGIFFGLDYPTPPIATRAYRDGRITRASFDSVVRAFRRARLPPQDTALGGALGVHGLGGGSRAVQHAVNWTDGCVALTNAQARELSRWVQVGTRVVIR